MEISNYHLIKHMRYKIKINKNVFHPLYIFSVSSKVYKYEEKIINMSVIIISGINRAYALIYV